MNQLQPEPINLRTGMIASSRLRQFCQLSPTKAVPRHAPARSAGAWRDCLKINYALMPGRNEITMNAEEKVSWLNEHARPRKWKVGEAVRCRCCGAVFKAERTAMDFVGDPTCPHCIASTPADFEKVLVGRKQ